MFKLWCVSGRHTIVSTEDPGLLACHYVLCLAGNSATKLQNSPPVDVETPLHCSVLPVPVGCALFAPLNSTFVCSRVKLHLRAVCCQQRARAKANRRLMASKAASSDLLLTLFQQEMMTRMMCCKTTSSLMTVIWRTDRASCLQCIEQKISADFVQCCCSESMFV